MVRHEADALVNGVLRLLRAHLEVEVDFVSEVADGHRTSLCVDGEDSPLVAVGDTALAEESYCHHVIAGNVPPFLADMIVGRVEGMELVRREQDARRRELLELDRVLVRDVDSSPDKQAMVAGLLAFAEQVGITVVAEGVETAGERTALANLGVHHAQGYLLARPQDVGKVLAAVALSPSTVAVRRMRQPRSGRRLAGPACAPGRPAPTGGCRRRRTPR